MTQRNPSQLCLLCLVRKANETGSHFTPAGLLKGTIGKRNFEEAHAIDPKEPATESHYGRSNLKSSSPVPTPNPHVADYIFCKECERNLGKIESEIIPFLDKDIYDSKKKSNYIDTPITNEMFLREDSKASPNIFTLFIYSVLWRICLQQRLEHNFSLVSAKFENQLRVFLITHLEKDIKAIAQLELKIPFPFIVLTSDKIEDKTATFVNPNIDLTNPYLFYVGSYIILIYHDSCAENAVISTLPSEIIDKSFANKDKDPVKILFVEKEIWDKVNYEMIEYAKNEYKKTMVVNLSKYKGIPIDDAAKFLYDQANKISVAKNVDFIDSLNEVYNAEMNA